MKAEQIKKTIILSGAVLLVFAGIIMTILKKDSDERPIKIGIVQYLDILDPAVKGFKEEMSVLGYAEGKDVVYLYASAGGSSEETESISEGFVSQDVDLIYVVTSVAARAALDAVSRAFRTDIPIVFAHGDNPVEAGLVQSLNFSGNNVTGVAVNLSLLTAKKLEILKQIKPEAEVLGVFTGENLNKAGKLAMEELNAQASRQGIEVKQFTIRQSPGIFSGVFLRQRLNSLEEGEIDAIMAIPSPLTSDPANIELLADFGKNSKIPTIALTAPQVEAGFLFAYAHDLESLGRQTAVFAHKVLEGTHPSQIPIEFPEENNLIVNLRTAGIMGITLPDSVLIGVDVKITN